MSLFNGVASLTVVPMIDVCLMLSPVLMFLEYRHYGCNLRIGLPMFLLHAGPTFEFSGKIALSFQPMSACGDGSDSDVPIQVNKTRNNK